MASLGVQVHGGMGFIEETGAAQYLRDARITTIYEGTTGIQANDLIGRKIARDGGRALTAAIADMRATERALAASEHGDLAAIGARLRVGIDALEEAGRFAVNRFGDDPRAVLAGAVPFLELGGIVCGGAQLGRAALIAANKLAAEDSDAGFLRRRSRRHAISPTTASRRRRGCATPLSMARQVRSPSRTTNSDALQSQPGVCRRA